MFFSREKTLFNVTHFNMAHYRKGISNFPRVLYAFMITTRVCLSLVERKLITESRAH